MQATTFEVEDVESEILVLRTLWFEPESRTYFPRILPHFFSRKNHAIFYETIKVMHEKHEPFDYGFVTIKLQGKMLPSEILDIIVTEQKLEREAFLWRIHNLKELYFYRISLNVAKKMSEFAIKREMIKVVKSSMALSNVHSTLFKPSEEKDFFVESAIRISEKDECIPSAFQKLNSLFGGWTRKDISSIGGKPGHNKTTFAIFDGIQALTKGYYNKLLYIAVDEPGEMVARRIIASELNISLKAMRDKRIAITPKDMMTTLSRVFKDRLIIIDDLFDADAIKQAICDIKADRVIIDHIQELDYGNEGISDQKVMVAAKRLKEAAKISRSNVTILSQVRDKLIDERFDNKIPRPHDFLYASDLRRKSRELAVVYWEYKDSQKDVDFPFFDFVLWKSTYSDTGRVKFVLNPDLAQFAEKEASHHTEEKPSSESDIWSKI